MMRDFHTKLLLWSSLFFYGALVGTQTQKSAEPAALENKEPALQGLFFKEAPEAPESFEKTDVPEAFKKTKTAANPGLSETTQVAEAPEATDAELLPETEQEEAVEPYQETDSEKPGVLYETSTTVVLSAKKELPKGASRTYKLPVFGKVELRRITSEKTGQEGVEIELVEPTIKMFSRGPLVLQAGVIRLLDGVVSYQGQAELFGQKATVGLKKLKLSQEQVLFEKFDEALLFSVAKNVETEKKSIVAGPLKPPALFTFLERVIEKAVFEIKPVAKDFRLKAFGKTLAFNRAMFVFKRNAPLKGLLKSTLFGAPVLFEVLIGQNAEEETDFSLSASVNRPLGKLFPFMSGDLAGLVFQGKTQYVKSKGFVFTGKLEGKTPGRTVAFEGRIDPTTKDFVLNGTVQRFLLTDLVPLLSQTFFAKFYYSGQITFSRAKGFDLKGQLEGETEGEKASVELVPGKKASFDQFAVAVGPDKKIACKAQGTFLGAALTLAGVGDISTQVLRLKGAFKHQVQDIVPDLTDDAVGKLVIDGMLSASTSGQLVIKGAVTDSRGMVAEETSIQGLQFQKATIEVNLKKQYARITGGIRAVGLDLEGRFISRWGKNSCKYVSAALKPTQKEWKPFAHLPSVGKELDRVKDITLTNCEVGTALEYRAVMAGEKHLGAAAPAVRAAKKVMKPEMREPEALSEQDLEEPEPEGCEEAAGNGSKKELSFSAYVKGTATILNTECRVCVQVGMLKGQKFALVVAAELPDGWKLSQSFPELFKEHDNPVTLIFDSLAFTKSRFAISTLRTTSAGKRLKVGINFESGVMFKLPDADTIKTSTAEKKQAVKQIITRLNTVINQTGDTGATLSLSGFIPPDIRNAELHIGLSSGDYGFKVGAAQFKASELSIVLQGEPAIGVEAAFTVIPWEGAEELRFAGAVKFTAVAFGIDVSMAGTFKTPPLQIGSIQIPGWEVGELGLRGSQTYTAVAEALGTVGLAALIPATAGITGKFGLGDEPNAFKAGIFVALGKDISNTAFEAEIENPESLIQVFYPLVTAIWKKNPAQLDKLANDVLKLFPVRLQKAKIAFIPLPTKIGQIERPMTLELQIEGLFAQKRLKGQVKLSSEEIVLFGSVESFTIANVFEVKGFDGKGDPTVDIALSLTDLPRFKIQGQMIWWTLLPPRVKILESKTDIEISKDRFAFESESCLGSRDTGWCLGFKTPKAVSFADPIKLFALKPTDLGLSIWFTDTVTAKIRNEVARLAEKAKTDFEKLANEVITQVVRQASIDDIINKQNEVVLACRGLPMPSDQWVHDLGLAKDARWTWLFERTVRPRMWGSFHECDKRVAELKLLKSKKWWEEQPLGSASRYLLQKAGILSALEKTLSGLKLLGVGALESGRFVLDHLANLAVVEKIYWSGTVQDLASGVIPGVQVTVRIKKTEERTVNVGDFDLLRPDKSILVIAKNIVALMRQALIGGLYERSK